MTDEEVAVKLAKHKEEIGSLRHRVDDLEKIVDTIHQLTLSVKELAVNMQSMLKEQERHAKAIEELRNKPSKNWNTLRTAIITAIASGLVTYFLTTLLK